MRGVCGSRRRARRPWWLIARGAALLACAHGCADGPPPFSMAAHVAYPEVPSAGGAVVGSAGLVAVTFSGDVQGSDLAGFLSALVDSAWLPRVLSEYGIRSAQYEGQAELEPLVSSSPSDADIQALLTAKLSDGTIPSSSGSMPPFVYVVFVPAGVSVSRGGSDACGGVPGGGYHGSLIGAGPPLPYVVVPSCDPPFSAILSQVAGMELEAARLLADTLTDPAPLNAPAYALTDPSNPWTTLGTEVGDLCWGRLSAEAVPATVQRVWSNAQIARGSDPCVPPPSGAVAFGISATPSELQVVHSEAPFTFEVTGWSAAPIGTWTVRATPWVGEYPMTVTLDAATLENGASTTLHVSLPDALPSGTLGAVLLQADRGTADLPAWPVAFVVR